MCDNGKLLYGDQDVLVPAHLNFGKYMLDQLRLLTDEVALENGDTHEKLTYKELTQYVVNLSTSLTKLNIGVGDTVALGSEKRIDFVPTALAIVSTGATYTPYNIAIGRTILRHELSIAKPKYFICSNLFWETYCDLLRSLEGIQLFITLDEAVESLISLKTLLIDIVNVKHFEPARVRGQCDVALVLYSSGTTGMTKGVQLTHMNCIMNTLPRPFEDQNLHTIFIQGAWTHNFSTFMTFKYLWSGKKIVYTNETTAPKFLKIFEEYKVDMAMIFPSMVGLCSKVDNISSYNLDSLKIIYSRTAPLHIKTIEKLKQKLPKLRNVLQGYGMTECGEPTSESWAARAKSGSVGIPSPGIIIKIVDPETNEVLGPHMYGEIRITGPSFMKGYIGIEPSTYLDEQGFFKSGDLGYYDENKYIYIVDRIKEIFFYDGYQIAPLELEALLLEHSKVQEAAIVGKIVPDFGEAPTAFIVKQPGADVTEKELMDFVASEMSPMLHIRGGVRFIDKMPRNSTGKILRRNLREILNENTNTNVGAFHQ